MACRAASPARPVRPGGRRRRNRPSDGWRPKHVADCHQAHTSAQAAHADRLADALRYEPCSPTCANWLRYGVQPRNPRAGLRPGYCKGKAHRHEYLGYAGRRILVSRKWSGKTLADHRADRKAWLTGMLGLPATDPSRYSWEPVAGLPLLIPVPRAAKLLGISRAAAYRFASAGDLPTKRLGRRVYVVSAKLREFIETEDEAA